LSGRSIQFLEGRNFPFKPSLRLCFTVVADLNGIKVHVPTRLGEWGT